ncbi:MAG: rRNA adenine N-6-methyltransferase family protein [Deferribacterota bacterium]|nr:rRNA adenine N-6-methyltransferase family protein [Deferribacterota bacterium]
MLTRKERFLNEIIGPSCNNNGLIMEAFGKVPREYFLDKALKYKIYMDLSLPIGFNQTMTKPSTMAYMISYLNLKKEHNVLEVGTGSGYQTAILANIFRDVYTIEINPKLYLRASNVIRKLYIGNVIFSLSNGIEGLPKYAPFNNIIISAELTQVPDLLVEQLYVGGVMVLPYKGRIVKIVKDVNKLLIYKLAPCKFVDFILD